VPRVHTAAARLARRRNAGSAAKVASVRQLLTTIVPVLGVLLFVATGCGEDETDGGSDSGGAPHGESGGGGEDTVAGSSGKGGRGGTAGAGGGSAGSANGGAGEAGSGNGGAGGTTGEAGGAGAGGAPAENGGEGGLAGECAVGRTVDAVFDEAGGTLELCAAEVTMPAGVLEEERTVSLSIVALPAGSPETLVPGGPAFRIDVEGDLPKTASAPLDVLIPHAATSRYVYLYVHAGGTWNYLEACTREDERIGQEAWTEGVFVALVETEDFPESVNGLGSGSVEVNFDGTSSTFDLDAEEIETHAIYDLAGAERTVTLSAVKTASDSSLERLRIDFAIDELGDASLVQITYGSTADLNGFWSYLPFHPGSPEVSLTRDESGELTGTLSADLTQGETVRPFSASFDVVVDRYRYPPEGYCNIPEG
jgi:hypothetical protein